MGRFYDRQVAAARKEMDEAEVQIKLRKKQEKERWDALTPDQQSKEHAQREVERQESIREARVQESFRNDPGYAVCQRSIGMRSVTIYNNGYVKVGTFGGGQVEKLISIENSTNAQKKSAAGRGAAAVLTGGLSLIGSKQRGDVWLTVVTDENAYTLHKDPPTRQSIEAAQQLAAAGQGVLTRLAAERVAPPPAGTPSSTQAASLARPRPVSNRLDELTELHNKGQVSDEEFQQLRSKLLNEL